MPRRGERRIDEWKIEVEGQIIKVPVWIIHSQDRYADVKVTFRAVHKDSNTRLRNTDINELRKDMEKEVKQWYHIEWELWISVDAGHSRSSGTMGAFNVHFGYDFYAIGKRPDGEQVHRRAPEPDSFRKHRLHPDETPPWDGEWKDDCRYADERVYSGLPSTGISESNWSGTHAKALIPATSENAEAVRHFDEMLRKLADEIVKRFEPDNIKDTIMRIGRVPSIPMLPEAEDDKGSEEAQGPDEE